MRVDGDFKIYRCEGEPGLIIPARESGRFHVVTEIKYSFSKCPLKEPPLSQLITLSLDWYADKDSLQEGLNIREKPTRGLSLCLEWNENADLVPALIEESKKFAEVSGHDYIALEGGRSTRTEMLSRGPNLYVVRFWPRLFHKIVNN